MTDSATDAFAARLRMSTICDRLKCRRCLFGGKPPPDCPALLEVALNEEEIKASAEEQE